MTFKTNVPERWLDRPDLLPFAALSSGTEVGTNPDVSGTWKNSTQKEEKALNSLVASEGSTPKPSCLSHHITKQGQTNQHSFQISRDSNAALNTSKALS